MARYLFMGNINQLLNHFHRREKRIKLQIEQLNELQLRLKKDICSNGWTISRTIYKYGYRANNQTPIAIMAELQSRRAANSYLLDELYHELAGVRGNIRQLSESKRRGNK